MNREEKRVREKARAKTIELLLGEQNPNADFYSSLFKEYNYKDSEMTPISPAKMERVNREHNIIITDEVYKDLLTIRTITNQTSKEVAYFIFGEEKPDGTVFLDTVISSFKPSETTSADFTNIAPILTEYVEKVKSMKINSNNKQIICHGHTHGSSPVSDNFSFGDLISYVQFNEADPSFKKREIETIAMMMPPCGDFNFIMYDNNPKCEGFYIFPNVYLKQKNGKEKKLPAYKNGDYLVNRNRHIPTR